MTPRIHILVHSPDNFVTTNLLHLVNSLAVQERQIVLNNFPKYGALSAHLADLGKSAAGQKTTTQLLKKAQETGDEDAVEKHTAELSRLRAQLGPNDQVLLLDSRYCMVPEHLLRFLDAPVEEDAVAVAALPARVEVSVERLYTAIVKGQIGLEDTRDAQRAALPLRMDDEVAASLRTLGSSPGLSEHVFVHSPEIPYFPVEMVRLNFGALAALVRACGSGAPGKRVLFDPHVSQNHHLEDPGAAFASRLRAVGVVPLLDPHVTLLQCMNGTFFGTDAAASLRLFHKLPLPEPRWKLEDRMRDLFHLDSKTDSQRVYELASQLVQTRDRNATPTNTDPEVSMPALESVSK